ncbi:hypothetical protein QVD17_32630 [Tagetes erecta]|uniref:Uncharacterized protein n=1 Tax=Tagetes erecta TaxID=13708 RepID=A0AAD8NDG8_TARER|nr:hypothetical protein QVD17_32630 [Tagetes erecta]
MENKKEFSMSMQEPELLDIDGIDFAKELANIPFYFSEISPDMEYIPYPKRRRIQPPNSISKETSNSASNSALKIVISISTTKITINCNLEHRYNISYGY